MVGVGAAGVVAAGVVTVGVAGWEGGSGNMDGRTVRLCT